MASPLYPMPTPSWLLPKVNSNPLAAFLGDPRQFLRNNSSTLIGLGAGIAGGGPDFGQAVSAGLSGAGQGAQIDTQRNQTQAQQNQTRAWIEANYPQYASMPLDQGLKFAYAAETAKKGGAAGAPTFSQTPVFLTDGKTVHAAQMSSGGGLFVDGKTLPGIPDGWSVVARPDNLSNVNLGGSMAVFDPNTGTYKTGPAIQGSPSTNMDVSLNPDGTRTMTPASGSDEAIKRRGNLTAAQSALSSLELKQNVVGTNIDRALQIAQTVPSTGGFSLLNAVPGTPQYDLKTTLDTIKANVGFDQLQQMRDNSPTGGALGQVSEMENRLLQSVLGSLDQAQSLDQFVQNLQLLKQILAQSTDQRRRAFAQDFPDTGATTAPASGQPPKTLTYNPNTGELE